MRHKIASVSLLTVLLIGIEYCLLGESLGRVGVVFLGSMICSEGGTALGPEVNVWGKYFLSNRNGCHTALSTDRLSRIRYLTDTGQCLYGASTSFANLES